jgi:YfiH family protein
VSFEFADWPLPDNVKAGWSTRLTGYSAGAFARNNIARHVGADDSVDRNRAQLRECLPGEPSITWLNQTHSVNVVNIEDADPGLEQDGSVTAGALQACCVMTADCLPIFLWTESGSKIAAIHAGWRGLANGVLQNGLLHFTDDEPVFAGIGPAISQANFEVGEDVLKAFSAWPETDACFEPGLADGKFWCDLPGLARRQLLHQGVKTVYQSGLCTFADSRRFYSYRRDGLTGRMANLIWKI